MNRRSAIRFAASFAFATALGKYDALAQGATPKPTHGTGALTVDLNQWACVVFKLGHETITIPVSEVFAALKDGPQ